MTSVDKANVLEASRLWRAAVTEVAAEYPDVDLEHRYVDAMSFEMLAAPQRFDVILADNLFGDILSDEAAAVVGLDRPAAVGLARRRHAALRARSRLGADLAGRGIANPTGAILSVAMMLEHVFERPDLARNVETAVTLALSDCRTPDVGGTASTAEFTARVLLHVETQSWLAGPEMESAPAYGWGV